MKLTSEKKFSLILVFILTFSITAFLSYIAWRDWTLIIICFSAAYLVSGIKLFFLKSEMKKYISAGLFFGQLGGASAYFLLNPL